MAFVTPAVGLGRIAAAVLPITVAAAVVLRRVSAAAAVLPIAVAAAVVLGKIAATAAVLPTAVAPAVVLGRVAATVIKAEKIIEKVIEHIKILVFLWFELRK